MIYEVTVDAHKIFIAVSANDAEMATKMAVTAIRQALDDIGAVMMWTDTKVVEQVNE